jgi:hypothetical protein
MTFYATARASRWLIVVLGFGGCELAALVEDSKPDERGLDDGAVCTTNEECASALCTSSQLCAHSFCQCRGDACASAGDPSPDCNEDWVCTDNESIFDGFREFFGGDPPENRGYCHAPCALGCPEHYTCAGQFCTPDRDWAAPVPTIEWTGAASGRITGRSAQETVSVEENQTVTLTASAKSPTDADIQSLTWTLVTGSGERVESSEATVEMKVEAGSYQRAQLTILDDRARASVAYVVFEACGGPGKTCGYQGSGCCNGCDGETNSCM